MAFTLENIVPWGRSFEEYVSMFSLTPDCLHKKILGCGDGPASFNSHMCRAGLPIVSLDPLYQFSANEIASRISKTSKTILEQLEQNRDAYIWTSIESPAELWKIRMAAMQEFLADLSRGKAEGRYISGELPLLPFEDNHFDLAICSHLLFLYSEHLSLEFHKQAIAEICRVAHEVRIFPLVTLTGESSPYVEAIGDYFRDLGHGISVEKVGYEFQRDGNKMMRITKP